MLTQDKPPLRLSHGAPTGREIAEPLADDAEDIAPRAAMLVGFLQETEVRVRRIGI